MCDWPSRTHKWSNSANRRGRRHDLQLMACMQHYLHRQSVAWNFETRRFTIIPLRPKYNCSELLAAVVRPVFEVLQVH